MSLPTADYELEEVPVSDPPSPPSAPRELAAPPAVTMAPPSVTMAPPAITPAPPPAIVETPAAEAAFAVPSTVAVAPVARRVRGEELVSAVFEEAHTIRFLGNALEAARYCLSLMQSLLPCQASMVHLFDGVRGDFIVVEARGEGAEDMVLKRHGTSDPLLRVVMPMGRAFCWNDLSSAPAKALPRFGALRVVERVLVSPILLGGRYLGALELVNPSDGEDFGFSDENALDYMARQYAAFLSEHGVVVDVATIARFAFDRE